MVLGWSLLIISLIVIFFYYRSSLVWVSSSLVGLVLVAVWFCQPATINVFLIALPLAFLILLLHSKAFRQRVFMRRVYEHFRVLMPTLSEAELSALEAGDVGWEAEIFSGKPKWTSLDALSIGSLTEAEQAFIDGPVEALCEQIKHWEIELSSEIPASIWAHLKKNGFFGMIIPKVYGGLSFSPLAHAEVVAKVASASVSIGTVVCVPNSLGPAELLLRYGSTSQKNYYLPRLAIGEEIPCFALTSPVAGSDASSITDSGVICRATYGGKDQLCLRLNWNKRYITLAPVATLLGLAFKCYDPEHLLGQKTELGITCALVPTDLPGITIGRRHYPLHAAFPNGPTQGCDVIIPLSQVIGEEQGIGAGWSMLMECLAAGRGISLPSMVSANARPAVLATGAYAKIREQFGLPIAEFEGIQSVLAEMTVDVFLLESTRLLTISALMQGLHPSVASAISKYHCTSLSRNVINHAMDIHGGKGICMGPSNYLAQNYIETPIAITVEGANILTRSLIIFGQGMIRCHPYLLTELKAAATNNADSLGVFDQALLNHLGAFISNLVRSFLLSIGCRVRRLLMGKSSRSLRMMECSRFSAAFAMMSDAVTLLLGSKLKRAEALSARMGDVFSYLYQAAAVRFNLKQPIDSGEILLDRIVMETLLYKIQMQFDQIIRHLPSRAVRCLMRVILFPIGRYHALPSDRSYSTLSSYITSPGRVRELLSNRLYLSPNENNPIGKLHAFLEKRVHLEPLIARFKALRKSNPDVRQSESELLEWAFKEGKFSREEAEQLKQYFHERMSYIHVDDFGKGDIE